MLLVYSIISHFTIVYLLYYLPYFNSFVSLNPEYIITMGIGKFGRTCCSSCAQNYEASDLNLSRNTMDILPGIEEIKHIQAIIRMHLFQNNKSLLKAQPINDILLPIHTRQRKKSFNDVPEITHVEYLITSNNETENDNKTHKSIVATEIQMRNPTEISKEMSFVEHAAFQNGAVYKGYIKDGKREGIGLQIWPDGAKYEGMWKINKANGKGKFTHIDGDIYEGGWVDDKACGIGIYYHSNGAKYEGSWKDDMQDGYGVESWVDGSRYEGTYKQGTKFGKGAYMFYNGSNYDGEWKDNKIYGFGIFSWNDGKKYEGFWKDGEMSGKGTYIWPDGRKYEGEFVNDKKNGYGIYTWPNGKKYEGKWENNKQHGEGKYSDSKGVSQTGVWENGLRIKWTSEEEIIKGEGKIVIT